MLPGSRLSPAARLQAHGSLQTAAHRPKLIPAAQMPQQTAQKRLLRDCGQQKVPLRPRQMQLTDPHPCKMGHKLSRAAARQ